MKKKKAKNTNTSKNCQNLYIGLKLQQLVIPLKENQLLLEMKEAKSKIPSKIRQEASKRSKSLKMNSINKISLKTFIKKRKSKVKWYILKRANKMKKKK